MKSFHNSHYSLQGSDTVLRVKLPELIALYQRLKDDNKSYLSNYKPKSYEKYRERKLITDHFTKTKDISDQANQKEDSFEIIIPSQNLHLQIECGMRIVNSYALLLQITKQVTRQITKQITSQIIKQNILSDEASMARAAKETKIEKKYIQSISAQFLGNKKQEGLLEQTRYQEVPLKTQAKIYNCLGNALLALETREELGVVKSKSPEKIQTNDTIDSSMDLSINLSNEIKQFRLEIESKLKDIDAFPRNEVTNSTIIPFVSDTTNISNTNKNSEESIDSKYSNKEANQLRERITFLELIYMIFKKAEGYSRETDFTKADAHHGMANTLRRYLNIHAISKMEGEKRKNIEKQIEVHENTRD